MKRWIGLALALLLLLPACAAAASDIYYVYAPACASCAKMKAALDALDAPGLIVHELNLFDQPDEANALFERYDVPEDDRLAPIVFLRDQYITDPAALQSLVDQGAATGTLPPDASAATMPLSWLGTATAGLVAGFNPCALSMLLFFLALLLPMGRAANAGAVSFLAAKLLTYLLIGALLVGVFARWNPAWLPMAAKMLLTAVGCALVIMNLMDAWRAHRAQYGAIKNQLPRAARGYLHRQIKRMMANPKSLIWSAAALGLIVAASEFMCSGQLYLATLTSALQRGERFAPMLAQLALFCAMFLLPSAVVTALVLRGKQSMELSGWMLRRMPLIKLATALTMTAIIAAAWVL